MKQRVAWLLGPEAVEIREEAVPDPGPDEVLVRIGAATTCGTDVKVWRRGGHPRMLQVPAPFGHELAGTIVARGARVDRFLEGDRVTVANSAPCGACEPCLRGRENLCEDLAYLNGAYAEFVLVPARFVERSLHRIPDTLPDEEAALAEPLACVLHGLELLRLDRPASAVVYGAGPIGLLFAAVLAASGHDVAVADPNPPRLEIARKLGARTAIPIRRGGGEADRVKETSPGGRGFELAVDATGVPEVWADAIASVQAGGTVELFGGCAPGSIVPLDTHRIHYSEITLLGAYHHRPRTFARALELLASSPFDARLLLSNEYRLEDIETALRAMVKKEILKGIIRG